MMPQIFDLHQAVLAENTTAVNQLVSSGVDLGARVRGATPLSLSVYHGNLEIFTILLNAGAPIDLISQDHLDRREPPIISAIRLGHQEMFWKLVRAGARLDVTDFYTKSPLYIATKELRLCYVTLLLEHGAPIRFLKASENPLNYAIEFMGYKPRREMATELVEAGLPTNLVDHKGRSALYWAMKNLDFGFFRLLVEAGTPLRRSPCVESPDLPRSWAEDEGIVRWIQRESTTPASLFRQCRTKIRILIRECHGTDIRPYLHKLPVPPSVLNFLLLKGDIEASENASSTSLDRQSVETPIAPSRVHRPSMLNLPATAFVGCVR